MLVETDFKKEVRFFYLIFKSIRGQKHFNYYLCAHNKFENYGKL